MTNVNKTRNALFTSIISLLLCVSMLVGTTFAWFTDAAETGVNQIVAGNLDIDLFYGTVENDVISYTEVVDEETLLFNKDALWEPGYTEVAYLKVENVGTLALKALLTVNFAKQVVGTSVKGNELKLSDYLMYDLIDIEEGDFYATRDAARAAAEKNAVPIATEQNELFLKAGDSAKYYALVVYMPDTVGNEANYRGETIPSIELGVTLIATQDTVEIDSWDELYDEKSEYPSSIQNNEGLLEALQSSDKVTIKNGNYELPLNIPDGKTLNVEGGKYLANATDTSTPAFKVGEGGNLTISTSEVVATDYNVAVQAEGNLTINAGTYASADIQVFHLTGSAEDQKLVINNGTVKKGTAAVWCDNENAVIEINGGEFNTWCLVTGDHETTEPVKITGGTFNLTKALAAPGQTFDFVITGGTFNIDPSAYVSEPYAAVENSDGTWTVKQMYAVEENGFTVMEPAAMEGVLEQVSSGSTVVLTENTFDAMSLTGKELDLSGATDAG